MNSISAYGNTDPNNPPMSSLSAYTTATPNQKKRWLVQAAAYVWAILVHYCVWQAYQGMKLPEPEIIPPPLEISIVMPSPPAPPAAAAPPPQIQPPPPKPQVQPPKPKPLPKIEKPLPPKPRPTPTLKPRPEPQVERTPEPETIEREEAPPAPPAPVLHKAPPKPAPVENDENDRYSTGTVGGYRMNYPAMARQRGWEGTVSVKIHVSADGDIESVSISGSSGHEILDEYALDMVRAARNVKPCHRGDKPVACSFTQPIQFRLNHE
jgi:protein TonB